MFRRIGRTVTTIAAGLSCLLACPAAWAQKSHPVTLNDIIVSAYDHHPQLKSLRAQLRGTEQTLYEARASYLPQMALTGSYNFSDREALLQDGTTFDQYTEPKQLALRVNQTLYTGGRRSLLQRGALVAVKSAQARYETISTGVAAEIIQDYMALLSAREEYKILAESVVTLGELERSVLARKEAGDATRIEVAQASSRLASARAQKSAAQAEYNLARDRLLSKTGFMVENPVLPGQASEDISETYETIKDKARRRSPAIKASRLDEQSAQIRVKSEKRKHLPTVTLTAAASAVRDSSPTIAEDDDLSVGINFTLPLYSGGSGNAQTRRAVAEYSAARHSTNNVIRESDLQINQLWSRLQSGIAVLKAQRANVAANEEALEGITRGEAVGLSNTQDILDAQQLKLEAELALNRALYQQYTASLLLKLYAGDLDVYDID